jgi:ABC-type Zn uptake system ZnuABC Zn-binding protein ZnuA
MRYAIALAEGSASVTLELGADTEVSVYLGSDVPLTVTDASGAVLEPEDPHAVGDECAAIATTATYDLPAGSNTLALGPTTGTDGVELVWEEASHEHHHGPEDPHFWVDPVSMGMVVEALTPALAEVGIVVDDTDLMGRLAALDDEVRTQLEPIPADARRLVTGHESMGYFADRYGFELVGTVIPGLSSQGEVSAAELAELADTIEAEGVTTIFTEIGTPAAVVEAIATETGASVVELPSHNLPEDGSYFTFIRGISSAIAAALS